MTMLCFITTIMSQLNRWWQSLWSVHDNHEEPFEEQAFEEEPIEVALNDFLLLDNVQDVPGELADGPAEIEEEIIQPLRRFIRIIQKPKKYDSFYSDEELEDMEL